MWNAVLLVILSLKAITSLAAPASHQSTHAYTLDNGLKLVVREDPRTPAVIAQLWYHVGSAQEPLGITGISHALEHMMFQGTPTMPEGAFTKAVYQVGGQFNAFTSYDMTVYHELVNTDSLDLCLKLEADRMQHLTLDPDSFAKEIQVVIEERRLRTDDQPQSVLQERFYAQALNANPYQNPVVGWRSDLDNMTAADLKEWYAEWYHPANATLVVVGQVDPETVFNLTKQHFGAIQSKKLPPPKPISTLTAVGQKRLEVKIPAQVPFLMLGYNTPTYKSADPKDIAALTVAALILDGDSGSRLTKRLMRDNNVAASVNVDYDPLMQHPTVFVIEATPAASKTTAELETAIQTEILDLQKTLVTDKELQRAKTLWLASQTFANDSLNQQALRIGIWENLKLSWDTADHFDTLIQSVTATDIQAVATRYLNPNNMTVGQLIPTV